MVIKHQIYLITQAFHNHHQIKFANAFLISTELFVASLFTSNCQIYKWFRCDKLFRDSKWLMENFPRKQRFSVKTHKFCLLDKGFLVFMLHLHGWWHQHNFEFQGKNLHAFYTVHLLCRLRLSFCCSQHRHLAVMDLSGRVGWKNMKALHI